MSEDLSRRKFLETVGLGTAASTGLWLFKDVAQGSARTSAFAYAGTNRRESVDSLLSGVEAASSCTRRKIRRCRL